MIVEKIVYDGNVHFGLSSAEASAMGIPDEAIALALQTQLGREIDTAAGNARAAFVSPGSHIDQEYLLAKQEANNWLAGGKDESAIPASVADHVTMTGQSAEEAAQEIVATAEQWEQALGAIRSIRLGGKGAVRKAASDEEKMQAANDAIAQLKAFRPQ